MEEAFTQTNMLRLNATNSGAGRSPLRKFSSSIIGESIPYVYE